MPSGPLRTEESRCVAGEESWSEPANTPAANRFSEQIHTEWNATKNHEETGWPFPPANTLHGFVASLILVLVNQR